MFESLILIKMESKLYSFGYPTLIKNKLSLASAKQIENRRIKLVENLCVSFVTFKYGYQEEELIETVPVPITEISNWLVFFIIGYLRKIMRHGGERGYNHLLMYNT